MELLPKQQHLMNYFRNEKQLKENQERTKYYIVYVKENTILRQPIGLE